MVYCNVSSKCHREKTVWSCSAFTYSGTSEIETFRVNDLCVPCTLYGEVAPIWKVRLIPSARMHGGGNDKEEVGRKAAQDRYLGIYTLFHAAVWAPLASAFVREQWTSLSARTALLTQLNAVTRHTSGGLGWENSLPVRPLQFDQREGMAREMESAEYSAIRKNFTKLKEVVTRGDIPATLFEEDLITQDVLRTAVNDTLRQDKRANDILGEVLDAVRISPAKINSFLDALEAESIAKDIAQNVRGEPVWV